MKRLLLVAAAVGLLMQPVHASGQLYNGVPDAAEYLDFLGGSGVSGGYGVQVGPYVGRFAGDPSTAQFSIYCVDYTHFAKDQWVNVTGLDAAGDLSSTRLDHYGNYQQAAYLASLFHDATYTQSQWGGIHAAIWSITSGVSVGAPAERDYFLGLASTNAAAFDTEGWYVLSPNPLVQLNQYGVDKSGQEFLMRREVSVPEPATFVLLATGLLMLSAFTRKRVTELREVGA